MIYINQIRKMEKILFVISFIFIFQVTISVNAQTDTAALYEEGMRYYETEEYDEAVFRFRKAAESGNAKAQNALAICYYNGNGVTENNEKAFEWYLKAAEQGLKEAQYMVGYSYYYGLGTDISESEAVKWFQLSANQGYAKAQFALGCCCEDGTGIEQNLEDAVYYYRLAAEQDLSGAQAELGRCYFYGNGTVKSYPKAVYWWEKAAEYKDPDAMHMLGHCYMDGLGVIKDERKAITWFEQAAEAGQLDAQFDLGSQSLKKNDYERGIKLLKSAAEQNHFLSQVKLGRIYEEGIGVDQSKEEAEFWFRKASNNNTLNNDSLTNKEYLSSFIISDIVDDANFDIIFKNLFIDAEINVDPELMVYLGTAYQEGISNFEEDYIKSVYWFKRAAELGNVNGQTQLGLSYLYGHGVEMDYEEALKWLRLGAEKDDPFAQQAIGYCYEMGYGVEKDYDEAYQWYKLAANQESPYAQKKLGDCYFRGLGTPKNDDEAIKWYRAAMDNGNINARERWVNILESRNDPKEIDPEEMYLLGIIYQENWPNKNIDKAIYWMELSCSNNYKQACEQLDIIQSN